MTLEIVEATEEHVRRLFDWSAARRGQDCGCQFCLYWEEPDRSRWPADMVERLRLKQEWFRRVTSQVSACGLLAFSEGELVGYAQFAAPRYLPTTAGYTCGPPDEDALFVSCLYVHRRRREGIGSALLAAVLEHAQVRGAAVESFASKGSENNPSGPLEFWLAHGFRVVREDERFALVRREPR
jgi:GNAT superfamily N-acetyltransferase